MEHYRIGFCPQCQVRIMVRDTDGRFNSFKPNYRNAYLEFPDGHRVKTAICAECLENPDFAKLMTSICHDQSEACVASVKENLRHVKRRKPLQKNEMVAMGKVFREAEEGDEEAKLTLGKKKYKEVGDYPQFEVLERGLPVRAIPWKMRNANGN